MLEVFSGAGWRLLADPEVLLGEDQLALTGNLQTVDLTLVFDMNALRTLEEFARVQDRPRKWAGG